MALNNDHDFVKKISPRFFYLFFVLAMILNFTAPIFAQEVDLKLPPPSRIKAISKPFAPAIIKAVTVNPKDPFLFDFVIDKGDTNLSDEAFEAETSKLVKYFLAALTIPENDLWVNLSPYEQDAMVPQVLGVTELGKDLLVEDYYLKQVTAQLTNPNTETGKKFWTLAYAKAQELYGTTQVPINTFSKVWIVPDHAVVLEKDGSAFIAESHLKVFLDQDYLAIKKNLDNKEIGTDKIGSEKAQNINGFSSDIIRQVVLPEIEKEINTGENFAAVRQIYSSAILAAWYKKRLKESLLGKLYADQNKVAGVNAEDMDSGDKIFEKYTAALKTGAYNIIKQDYDLSTQKVVQRKYFSGGVKMAPSASTSVFKMDDTTLAALSPAASNALSSTIESMRASSNTLGLGSANHLVNVTIALRGASSAIVANVNNTILGRGASHAGMRKENWELTDQAFNDVTSKLDPMLAKSTTSQIVPPSSIQFKNMIPLAVTTLANMSAKQVSDYTTTYGINPKQLADLHTAIQKAIENVAPEKRAAAINNFVPPQNITVSPLILGHLVQQQNPSTVIVQGIKQIAEMPKDQFEANIAALTPTVAPTVIDSLKSIRTATETLTPKQTAFAVVSNPSVNLSALATPTPQVQQAFLNTTASNNSVISQSDQQSLAYAIATVTNPVSLGIAPSDIAAARAEQQAVYNAANAYQLSNIQTPVLSRYAATSTDTILANLGTDPATAQALMDVANSNDDDLKRRLEAFSDAIKLKVQISQPALAQIRKTNTNPKTGAVNPVAFMNAVKNSDSLMSLAASLNKNPILLQSIIAKPSGTTTTTNSDRLTNQITAAESIVNMDTSKADTSDYIALKAQMKFANISAEDQATIILRELPKVRLAISQGQISTVEAIHQNAPTLAAVLNGNDKFVTTLIRTSGSATASSPLLASNSRAVALLVTTAPEQVATLFNDHPNAKVNDLSVEDKTKIGLAMQAIAKETPNVFANQSQLYSTLSVKIGPDLAILVANKPEVERIATVFDNKVNSLASLVTVDEKTLTNALTAAGESPNVAQAYIAFRTAQPARAQAGTVGLAQAISTANSVAEKNNIEDMAEVLSRAAAKPEFQQVIASDTNAIANVSPQVVDQEGTLEVVASQMYAAYNASTEQQKARFGADLARIQPERKLTAPTLEAIKIWVAKSQGTTNLSSADRIAKAPEVDALLKLPKVRAVFASNQTRASSTVNYIQNVLTGTVDEGKLRESVKGSLRSNKFTPDEKESVAGGLIAIRNVAASNPEVAAQIAALTTVEGLHEMMNSNPALANTVTKAQKEALGKLEKSDVQTLGGIDLSAERMDLNIKRDGQGVVMPVSDQDIKNLKIEGLAPVVLDVQPATPANVPFLMNLSSPASAK